MTSLFAVLLVAALAQAPEDGVDAGADDEGLYEVRVYRPLGVMHARRAVIRDMQALGWRAVRERNGVVVFKGPRGWMGKAYLRPDGFMDFTAPKLLLQSGAPEALEAGRGPTAQRIMTARLDEPTQFSGLDAPVYEIRHGAPGLASVTLAPGAGKAKLRGARDAVVRGVEPSMRTYREAVQEQTLTTRLAELESALRATWEEGAPLQPRGAPLLTHAERRAAILAYWASRTDTSHGHRVCEVVEAWLIHVVMPSDHPLTEKEVRSANEAATAGHGRTLPPLTL